jgi:AraC-like DNA-binding protein
MTLASVDSLLDFSQFRAAVNDSFVPLQVTSDRPEPFAGRIRHADRDGVHLSLVEATAHQVERTPALIAARQRHCFKVGMQLNGRGILVQDGRETLLEPGSLSIYDTSRPYSLAFDGPFRNFVVMLPADRIDLPLEAVSHLTAAPLHLAGGTAPLVTGFLRGLAEDPEAISGPVGSRIARSTVDLIVALLSQELAQAPAAADPRRQLFEDVLLFIEEHLRDTDLDPAHIAAAHFISPRLLHALFQENGRTVSTWVRRRRLDQCRVRLADPALAHRSVMSIATDWGFTDPAHFSRVYRAEFGCSPSSTRTTAIDHHTEDTSHAHL